MYNYKTFYIHQTTTIGMVENGKGSYVYYTTDNSHS